jgi:hypothetical protein
MNLSGWLTFPSWLMCGYQSRAASKREKEIGTLEDYAPARPDIARLSGSLDVWTYPIYQDKALKIYNESGIN